MSKSKAAIDRAEEASNSGNKKPVPGRYFIAEPRVIDGGELPTRDEWILEMQAKRGKNKVSSKFSDGANSRANIRQGKNNK